MKDTDMRRALSNGEVLLAAMGYDVARPDRFELCGSSLPILLEDQIFNALNAWTTFCGDMASWYVASFAQDPIILIGSPTMEMCAHYQIPARRSFIVRTLGRIIEDIGNRHFVGIVDCNLDPLSDPALSGQANHWAVEFAKHDQLPRFFEALERFPDA
ncbi:hypothetical protein [Roseovarius marisflavi]|nr:hypothetical protein [Roseovarius marisflavi]